MNYLINQGKAKINTKEKTGGTIFMAACANGCLELIDYLMDLK